MLEAIFGLLPDKTTIVFPLPAVRKRLDLVVKKELWRDIECEEIKKVYNKTFSSVGAAEGCEIQVMVKKGTIESSSLSCFFGHLVKVERSYAQWGGKG